MKFAFKFILLLAINFSVVFEAAALEEPSLALELTYNRIEHPNYIVETGTGLPNPSNGFALQVEYFPIHQVGKLGISGGLSYFNQTRDFVALDLADATVNVWGLSLEGGLVYHADFFVNQILVPYAKLVPTYILSEQYGRITRSYSAQFAIGYTFGVAFLLDILEPGKQNYMERQYGVNNVYLIAEYSQLNLSSTTAQDLSSKGYRLGLRFEF